MKLTFQKFYLKSESYLFALIAIFYFSFLLFQFPYLPDQDAYFHIKISEMIMQNGWLIDKLPWMTQSIMADKYVDYHLLFQVLQIPSIAVFKDLILASKLSNITFMAFSTFSFNFLMKYLKVKSRWFWFLLFLIASPIFTGRLLYGRGATLFVGIFFIYIYLFLSKRNWQLFVLSFIIMWTYPAFLVLLAFLFFYNATCYLNNSEISWKATVGSVLGLISGMIIHPSFPNQFYGFWLEVFGRFFHPVGLEGTGEWSSPNAQIMIPGIIIPVILFMPIAIQADYAVLKISPEHARAIESLIQLERSGEKSLKEVYRNEKYIVFQFKNIYKK